MREQRLLGRVGFSPLLLLSARAMEISFISRKGASHRCMCMHTSFMANVWALANFEGLN